MLINKNPGDENSQIKVGGQAVIEGIMMRAPKTFTVVVRETRRRACCPRRSLALPDGEVAYTEKTSLAWMYSAL